MAAFTASLGIGSVALVFPVRADELGASGAEVVRVMVVAGAFAVGAADRYARTPIILARLAATSPAPWWRAQI